MGLVNEFGQETSLHGVKFVLQECASKPRRVLWTAVILAQVVGFLFVIVDQLLYVHSRPTLTKSSVSYVSELAFPAVTLCGELSNWTHDSMSEFDNSVIQNLYDGNKIFFRSLPAAVYKNISLANILKKRLLVPDSMAAYCVFAKRQCNKHVRKTLGSGELCYTVNSVISRDLDLPSDNKSRVKDREAPPLVSRVPGLSSGLHIVLQLNSFQDTGLKITLHQPNEKITLMDSGFLQLSPGSVNYIAINARQNKFLPAPYRAFGDQACVEISKDFSHPLVTQGQYTLRACLDACIVKQSSDFCGCELTLNGDEVCDPLQMIECKDKMLEAFLNDSLAESICDCPVPCNEVLYETTLSSTQEIDKQSKQINREKTNFDSSLRFLRDLWARAYTSRDTRAYTSRYTTVFASLHQDVMAIHIYFDRLRIDLTEQVEDYTVGDVFATVGGQMGLFLGASLITLVEMIEMLVRCAHRSILGRREVATKVSNHDHSAGTAPF